MLSSVEQAFVGREEILAPLKTFAWEARLISLLFAHLIASVCALLLLLSVCVNL